MPFLRTQLITFGLVILSAIAARQAAGAITVGSPGDVVYTVDVTDPTATLTNNIYFYSDGFSETTGNLDDLSPGVSVDDVYNPTGMTPTIFGALGVYTTTDVNNVSTSSAWVGFNDGGVAEAGVPFETQFADFFSNHPDVNGEAEIVAALNDPLGVIDGETSDDSGEVVYQFRDYVSNLSETQAAIDDGTLTLVHFGDGTSFGVATATQVLTPTPEPTTLALVGLATLPLLRRRR